LALTKPGITLANTLMVALGLAAGVPLEGAATALLLVGSAALIASSAVANMLLERGRDARMRRTARRPLPSRELGAPVALLWSAALGALGVWIIGQVSAAALLAGVVGWGAYVLLYTPLKPRSAWSMAAGALAGAMPPVMGALAADAPGAALALGLMLAAWQLPHVAALTLRHRTDYRASGLRLAALPDVALVMLARGGAMVCCMSALLAATCFDIWGLALPLAALPALLAALRGEQAPRWAVKVFGHGFWLFLAAPLVVWAAWT
jgi:protoheme IX farnesyltransferase